MTDDAISITLVSVIDVLKQSYAPAYVMFGSNTMNWGIVRG